MHKTFIDFVYTFHRFKVRATYFLYKKECMKNMSQWQNLLFWISSNTCFPVDKGHFVQSSVPLIHVFNFRNEIQL